MTIRRRCFVAGALAGVAAAGIHVRPAAARISPAVPDPVMLLLDPGAPPAFMEAAAAALAALRLSVIDRRAGDVSVLAESVAWLAGRPGRRMVGLLSDADAVLLEQMAWDGAIRCLSSAQHCGSAGGSRHRITALSSNAGLSRLLAVSGTTISIVSESPATPRGAVPASPAFEDATGRGWEATLGRTLALIAAGSWPDQSPEFASTFDGLGPGGRSETFAFRSFVFAS